MTTSKTAKLSVLTTLICLILCGSMLLGSTYAWFSDSVNNTENIIASGKLDVEMTYSTDGSSWTDASTGKIFNYTLWEPGYTDVKYIKIENAGNLAFKFALTLTTGEGADTKLAEVIDVYMGTGATSRNDVTNMICVGTLADLMADPDGAAYGTMLPGQSQAHCIALKMRESAGNEYQNLSVGNGIAVKLYAEQLTYESDSFGPDYDKNAGLPVAAVYRTPQYEHTNIPWGSYGSWSPSNTDQQLEAAYTFSAVDTAETVVNSPYKDWICDYVVYADKDIPAGKIFLGGYYEAFNAWVGFENPVDVAANEQIPLLGSVAGSPWTYENIVTGVGTFICGVADIDNALTGTTFTVELRLTNPDDANEYYVINSTAYTFKKQNPSDLPKATVTNLDVPEQNMYIIPDITQGFEGGSDQMTKLDAAFTFTAQDDSTTVANNPYKDWLVDYYVSVNEKVEDGIILAGAYGNWESGAWYGFNVPAGTYTEPVPLLGAMSTGGISNWTYKDIVTGVGTFNCGVVNNNDNNNGKIMTVELRAINPENHSEYYVISSTTHTFQ